jgi:NO-binding membrane sensor protein with MHYT domain
MGSVGIWSMHFIGNNSLTLVFPDTGTHAYQLAYSGGFTFASLIVSIACMFVSFSFVGVTEHVQVYRILLSGFFAGVSPCVVNGEAA